MNMEILKDFSNNTSIAPIPAISRSRSYLAKLLWIGIFVFSLTMLAYQTVDIILRYYEYPKSVSLTVKPKSATFPWITLCNTENVNYRIYAAANPENGEMEDTEMVRDMVSRAKNIVLSMSAPRDSYVRNKNDPDEQEAFKTYLNIAYGLSRIFFHHAEMVIPYLGKHKRIGLDLDQLVALCVFEKQPCNFEDFHSLFDYRLYNCFTYKPSNKTSTIREESGLTLVLFSAAGLTNLFKQDLETIDDIVKQKVRGRFPKDFDQRSIKVYVHPPNTKPGSYRESIDIGPGQFTNIQIKESFISRITTPKEKCQEGKTTRWEGIDYDETFIDCHRQCVYDYVWEKCNCHPPEVILGLDDPENKTRCNDNILKNFTDIMDNYKKTPMLENVKILKKLKEDLCTTKALNEAFEMKHDCHLPCKERRYATSISSSPWPKNIPSRRKNYTYGIMNDIFSTADFASKFTKQEKDVMEEEYGIPFKNITQEMKKMHRYPFDLQKDIMSHFTLVDIYYSNTDVEHYVESRDYLVRNLCSDFGGILGLWVGISVVTAFEVIELFVHIFMACFHLFKMKTKGEITKVRPMVQPPIGIDGNL